MQSLMISQAQHACPVPLVHPGNVVQLANSFHAQRDSVHEALQIQSTRVLCNPDEVTVSSASTQGGRPYQEDAHSAHSFRWNPRPSVKAQACGLSLSCSPSDSTGADLLSAALEMCRHVPQVGHVGSDFAPVLPHPPTHTAPAHALAALVAPAAYAAEVGPSDVPEPPPKARRVEDKHSPRNSLVVDVARAQAVEEVASGVSGACGGTCGARPAIHAGEEVLLVQVHDGHGGGEVACCASQRMVHHVMRACQQEVAGCEPHSVSPRSVLPHPPTAAGTQCLDMHCLSRALIRAVLSFDSWLADPANAPELFAQSQSCAPDHTRQPSDYLDCPGIMPAPVSLHQYGRMAPGYDRYIGPSAGSTALLAVVTRELICVACVGDSKALASCEGHDDLLTLSVEHKATDPSEEARVRAAGGWVSRSGRVNSELDMSRALGDMEFKQTPRLPPTKQAVIAVPDVVTLDRSMHRVRWLLLCTDGLSNALADQEIQAVVDAGLAAGDDPEAVCRELCARACTTNTTVFDNVTALLVVPGTQGDVSSV